MKNIIKDYNVAIEGEKVAIEGEKQAFDDEKQAFDDKKQAFELLIEGFCVSAPTKKNILKLYYSFGFEMIFARADVMRITGITESPATELIRKLKSADLIEPVSGYGKGKYKFKLPKE